MDGTRGFEGELTARILVSKRGAEDGVKRRRKRKNQEKKHLLLRGVLLCIPRWGAARGEKKTYLSREGRKGKTGKRSTKNNGRGKGKGSNTRDEVSRLSQSSPRMAQSRASTKENTRKDHDFRGEANRHLSTEKKRSGHPFHKRKIHGLRA